jgi:methionine synthase I (cobalamin-dependent)
MEPKHINDPSKPRNGETRYNDAGEAFFHMDGEWWKSVKIVCECCGQYRIKHIKVKIDELKGKE